MTDTQKMRNYTVTWTVDIRASHPAEAAKIARDIQQDPGNHASMFEVSPWTGNLTPSGSILIDLQRH